ncbi:ABC transporter permease [Paenibacillus sp. YPG26]|uniref:ABC transporter permease n=1 Tax=Paenibacillus sp. YPG26 TaxID=2878915 RepID=UPI0020400EF3|nr:ABC transporter permease [Paenibacillus sp. YPG26]USB33079.1 ABC transporter permease [Paenibacillus sp. YPG26]
MTALVHYLHKLLRSYGPFLLLLTFILILWEWLVRGGTVPAFIVPAPSSILAALIHNRELLLGTHLPVTLAESALGFALSVLFGTCLGTWMHLSRTVERAVYPFVIISQTLPLIALSPIFIMWFGYSIWSKVAVVILTAFFPIVVGAYDGLRTGGQAYSELLRTMGANRLQLLLKLQIPLALPSFFSGLKLSVVYCVIGATIGEWLGGSSGLGYYSRRMAGNLKSDQLFAAVLLLSLLGLALFLAVALMERAVLSRGGFAAMTGRTRRKNV